MSQTNKPRNHKSAAKLLAASIMVLVSHGVAKADEAAQVGRQGQALGQQLTDSFQFPTQSSNGAIDLGAGETISPSDMAPNGSGFYIQNPNVDGLKTIYDSEESMYDVGRESQNKLWEDAQAQGNPFDPNPSKRNEPGPSTISGSIYQVVLGAREARGKVPDLTNDPIVNSAADHITNSDLLESFGDCSVESEVVESSRPVHVPDLEYCERIIKPASGRCQVKHEIVVKRTLIEELVDFTATGSAPTPASCRGAVNHGQAIGGSSTIKVDLSNAPYDLCNAETEIKNLEISIVSITGASSVPRGPKPGEGTSCSVYTSSRPSGMTLAMSSLQCVSGVPSVTITGTKTGMGLRFRATLGSVTLRLKADVKDEQISLEKDNWYPEECVAQAKKS